MPATRFICPDNEEILIEKCLTINGCRMPERCATLAYLRVIGYDREWKGVSPSNAGTGPRQLYLKATTDYAINPDSRTFAALGTAVHEKLSIHRYTNNIFAEEKLSDDDMAGIADVLELDENKPGYYILTDYKTWGSYKVGKALGLTKKDIPLIENGEPVLLKSGKNKGKPKTRAEITLIPSKADVRETELQLNRYRIFFEKAGFPVSKIIVQAIVRDGGTYIAKNRGLDKNLYLVHIPIIPDQKVLDFYIQLRTEVDNAFETGIVRTCDNWESWDKRRCKDYCEVYDACEEMEITQ